MTVLRDNNKKKFQSVSKLLFVYLMQVQRSPYVAELPARAMSAAVLVMVNPTWCSSALRLFSFKTPRLWLIDSKENSVLVAVSTSDKNSRKS